MKKPPAPPAVLESWQTIIFASNRLPMPTPEYVFALPRRWRMDFAWIEQKVALEIDGGAWVGGRHTSGAGFVKDMEKHNATALGGWRVFRMTPQEFRRTDGAWEFLRTVLAQPNHASASHDPSHRARPCQDSPASP